MQSSLRVTEHGLGPRPNVLVRVYKVV